MKKLLTILLSFSIISSVMACTAAKAADYQDNSPTYFDNTEALSNESLITLVVNGTVVDTSELPKTFYKDGETSMVPALIICKILGYSCTLDSQNGTLTIEDSIQKLILTKGETDAEAIGKLKVINLSGTISLNAPMAVIDDVVYVPTDVFDIFFNNVDITDDTISISEAVCYPEG